MQSRKKPSGEFVFVHIGADSTGGIDDSQQTNVIRRTHQDRARFILAQSPRLEEPGCFDSI